MPQTILLIGGRDICSSEFCMIAQFLIVAEPIR